MATRPYRLRFTPAALRELEKLDGFVRRRVFSGIDKLADDPRPPGVRTLEAREKL